MKDGAADPKSDALLKKAQKAPSSGTLYKKNSKNAGEFLFWGYVPLFLNSDGNLEIPLQAETELPPRKTRRRKRTRRRRKTRRKRTRKPKIK